MGQAPGGKCVDASRHSGALAFFGWRRVALAWAPEVEAENDERWVLLAEDDGALRFLLASVLRKDGHRVLEVPDGEQLVVAHAALPPGRSGRTVVLSDLSMPVRSGLEAVEELQRREPGLGIILMGAFLEPGDAPRAAALGAAFLTKPFELARMRALVRALAETPGARAVDLLPAMVP